jgi:para-aminobenzoate synthetase / 4-amino-4-deoxychorismate lyase
MTGAPKLRTMQAIAELEQRPRGVYSGAIGFLTPGRARPRARFSVAIRTVTVANDSSYAEYGTGGGITYASDPDAEWAELLTKTAVLRQPPRPDGLIETLRFEPPRRLVNLRRHLARLRSSADYFGFRYEQAEVLSTLMTSLEHRRTAGRVRIVLRASGAVEVRVENLVPGRSVLRIGLADQPVDSCDVLLFHKHTDRRRYDRFRDSRPGFDDAVLWNERDQITEATTANLAVHLDDRWWTPSIACGLLPGVERGRLLDAGVLRERVITIDELSVADSIALINSLRGWRSSAFVRAPPGIGVDPSVPAGARVNGAPPGSDDANPDRVAGVRAADGKCSPPCRH